MRHSAHPIWRGRIFAHLIVTGLLVLPLAASAASILPVCNTGLSQGRISNPCGFKDVITLFNNVLKFLITIATPIATIAFAYAGVLYLTAGGNPAKISRAHGIFLNVGIGLVIILSAWLIVRTVLQILGATGNYINILQ